MDEPVLDRATATAVQLLKTPARGRVSSLNACFGEGWWWGRGGAVGRMGAGGGRVYADAEKNNIYMHTSKDVVVGRIFTIFCTGLYSLLTSIVW